MNVGWGVAMCPTATETNEVAGPDPWCPVKLLKMLKMPGCFISEFGAKHLTAQKQIHIVELMPMIRT